MIITQQLEQKGLKKGRAEGIQLDEQRGIEKGEREATLKIALTMIRRGIDRVTVIEMTVLSDNDLQQLRH